MGKSEKPLGSPCVNDTNNLSISFASLLPSTPDEVASYLVGVSFALGGREADLARLLGVSRATLSSWKARGAIPDAYKHWFVEEFPRLVLSSIKPAPGDYYRHAGLPAALQLIRQSEFNPFGIQADDDELMDRLASHMGGLVRLAQFIQNRLPLEVVVKQRCYEEVARILGEVAQKCAHVVLPRPRVSQ